MSGMTTIKNNYRVPCTWQMYGYVNVEASNWDDAIEGAEGDEIPIPQDGDYVIASFEVDYDAIESGKDSISEYDGEEE